MMLCLTFVEMIMQWYLSSEGSRQTKILNDASHNLVSFSQFKKGKNTYGVGLFLVKLEHNGPPSVFFMFFKLQKWYKIAQNVTNIKAALLYN